MGYEASRFTGAALPCRVEWPRPTARVVDAHLVHQAGEVLLRERRVAADPQRIGRALNGARGPPRFARCRSRTAAASPRRRARWRTGRSGWSAAPIFRTV